MQSNFSSDEEDEAASGMLILTAWDMSKSRRDTINNPGWSWPFHHGTSCSFSEYERLQRQGGELGRRETREIHLCLSVSV